MPQATTPDGVKLYYEETGSGTPITPVMPGTPATQATGVTRRPVRRPPRRRNGSAS